MRRRRTRTSSLRVSPRPHHQHLFNARLDFDVDGTTNTVYEVEAAPVPTGPDNPLGNAFRQQATALATEAEAQRQTQAATSRHWRVVNPTSTNRLGAPVGYRLVPTMSTPTLLAQADSSVAERAGFARHNLWVTPYSRDERRAAGEFPNQHAGGDGLPRWTSADRPITERDIVCWYTFGVTHFVRPEDWPVMPVEYAGFLLSPFGFFERNPALDVPPSHRRLRDHRTAPRVTRGAGAAARSDRPTQPVPGGWPGAQASGLLTHRLSTELLRKGTGPERILRATGLGWVGEDERGGRRPGDVPSAGTDQEAPMVMEHTPKARRWLSLRFFWGVLFILGGLACIGHAIVVPASKHDVTHGIGPQGPETTDSAALGLGPRRRDLDRDGDRPHRLGLVPATGRDVRVALEPATGPPGAAPEQRALDRMPGQDALRRVGPCGRVRGGRRVGEGREPVASPRRGQVERVPDRAEQVDPTLVDVLSRWWEGPSRSDEGRRRRRG